MIDLLCFCGKLKSQHDLTRCDKRCVETGCVGFRLAAHQPEEVLVHRHSHGPKPGKGMAAAVDLNLGSRK